MKTLRAGLWQPYPRADALANGASLARSRLRGARFGPWRPGALGAITPLAKGSPAAGAPPARLEDSRC
jgi:hypothetical protein